MNFINNSDQDMNQNDNNYIVVSSDESVNHKLNHGFGLIGKDNPSIMIKANHSRIVSEFIDYYYSNINNKSFNNLSGLYKNYSEIKFNGKTFKGTEEIYKYYYDIIIKITKFDKIDYDYMLCGSRRLNILVRGSFTSEGKSYRFSEFIHLSTTKDSYWIPGSIFNYE